MTRSKLPTLGGRTQMPRAQVRHAVALTGRCQVGDEPPEEVEIRNLDRHGCRLRGLSTAVTKADPFRLWLGPLGPIAGRLRWAKQGSTGIEFDKPLAEAELERALSDARPVASDANVLDLVRRRV